MEEIFGRKPPRIEDTDLEFRESREGQFQRPPRADDSPEVERLARLEADQELVNALMWRGYAGPEWDCFAQALAEYGFPVIAAWTYSGAIFRQCALRGFGGLPYASRTWDDAEELSGETVAEALGAFRENVLIPGLWDPNKGANLRTFFIGQCILRFPNIYRRWLREQGRAVSSEMRAVLVERSSPITSPSHHAELVLALESMGPEDPRAILAMIEMGFSQSEIAQRLEISLKRVQNLLYRFRKTRKVA